MFNLAAPLATNGEVMIECADGFKIAADPRDYFGAMMLCGRYSPEIVALFREHVKPGDSVLDIGAQIGYTTCHLARLVGPSGRVQSFEPDPNALTRLRAAVEHNGFPQVDVFRFALGSTNGEITFNVSATTGWSTAVRGSHLTNLTASTAQCRRLDDLETRRPVSFVKIDVEGFECDVIDGMTELLRTDHPTLLVEVNPNMLSFAGHSSRELLERIAAHGYRIFTVSEEPGVFSGGKLRLREADAVAHACDVLCVHR